MKFDRTKMIEALQRVVQRMHYSVEVMLVCVRWYAAYPLSLRSIEEIMAERGVAVDHATVHRWTVKIRFCSYRCYGCLPPYGGRQGNGALRFNSR